MAFSPCRSYVLEILSNSEIQSKKRDRNSLTDPVYQIKVGLVLYSLSTGPEKKDVPSGLPVLLCRFNNYPRLWPNRLITWGHIIVLTLKRHFYPSYWPWPLPERTRVQRLRSICILYKAVLITRGETGCSLVH